MVMGIIGVGKRPRSVFHRALRVFNNSKMTRTATRVTGFKVAVPKDSPTLPKVLELLGYRPNQDGTVFSNVRTVVELVHKLPDALYSKIIGIITNKEPLSPNNNSRLQVSTQAPIGDFPKDVLGSSSTYADHLATQLSIDDVRILLKDQIGFSLNSYYYVPGSDQNGNFWVLTLAGKFSINAFVKGITESEIQEVINNESQQFTENNPRNLTSSNLDPYLLDVEHIAMSIQFNDLKNSMREISKMENVYVAKPNANYFQKERIQKRIDELGLNNQISADIVDLDLCKQLGLYVDIAPSGQVVYQAFIITSEGLAIELISLTGKEIIKGQSKFSANNGKAANVSIGELRKELRNDNSAHANASSKANG